MTLKLSYKNRIHKKATQSSCFVIMKFVRKRSLILRLDIYFGSFE